MKRRAPFAQLPLGALLTTADVTRVLRASERQVRAWAAAGELQGEETWGGQWIFRKRDVEAFWKATGGRPVRPRAVTPTGQLPLPVSAPRFRRPTPQPWTFAKFKPVMIRAGLRRTVDEEGLRRVS